MAAKLLKRIRGWFGALFQKRRLDADMDEEMRAHVEMRARAHTATGMEPWQARRTALRQFGAAEGIKEACRDGRGVRWLEDLVQDLRFGARMLLKLPGLTAVAVVSLALGIAANTTIFSFVNTLLLRPPPVEKPGELWQVWRLRAREASEMRRYAVWERPSLACLRTRTQSFSALGGFEFEPTLASWNRQGLGESVQSVFVSGNFFEVCGIRPARGRFFLPHEDETPGAHPVVVVSHDFWQNSLGAEPQAIGRTLIINGMALTVVGVAPGSFKGTTAGISPDLWVPFMMAPAVLHDPGWLTRTDSHSVVGLGRLKPGVGVPQAAAELTSLTRQYEQQMGAKEKLEDGAMLTPCLMVPAALRGFVRTFTGMLMGAVILVLLIACANAANLQLARAVARRPEMSLRAALGAARGRLIRQVLTESALLAMLGGGLGLLLSVWLARLLGRLIPSSLPIRFATELDWRVLVFTAVVSLLTAITFGLAPALRGTRREGTTEWKDETRGTVARRSRFASALVAGQMAVCMVLLLAATLCLRSLFNAQAFKPGFEVADRIAAGFDLNDFGYTPAQAREFYARLLPRVQSLPGLRSAALTLYLPLGADQANGTLQLEGRETGPGQSGFFFEQFAVGAGYFATMGTKLMMGREFSGVDREGTPRVAMINDAAAKRYWPGENPIGRRLFVGEAKPENACEIVGVVQTGQYRTLGENATPAFFQCFDQAASLRATLVAHVQGDPARALETIRSTVRELDPRLALTRVNTLRQHLSLALFPIRTSGLLLGTLGLVALLLAVSGLFGVIAYSVSQRTREIGIRMALGAGRQDILRLILRQGLRLVGIGTLLGLGGALAGTRLLRGLLFGVSPTDPVTFLTIPLLLLGVAGLACWLPARRAAKVEPMTAMRNE